MTPKKILQSMDQSDVVSSKALKKRIENLKEGIEKWKRVSDVQAAEMRHDKKEIERLEEENDILARKTGSQKYTEELENSVVDLHMMIKKLKHKKIDDLKKQNSDLRKRVWEIKDYIISVGDYHKEKTVAWQIVRKIDKILIEEGK